MRTDKAPEKAELIAEWLRGRILAGELADGDSLGRVVDLADEYAVSRSSLREALRMLEAEGLVSLRRGPGGGVQVHQPTERRAARNVALLFQSRDVTLADVQEARTLFEPLAVRLLASRRNRRATAEQLRHLVERQRETVDDISAFGKANAEFHQHLYSLVGNQTVAIMAEVLYEIVERAIAAFGETRSLLPRAARAKSLRSQERLVELIAAGDGAAAEEHWRAHLLSSTKNHSGELNTRVIDLLDHE
jgi:GntR family transcriptional regulator, transcriptional repressor for pyruvate dehydrogenase complex